MVKYCMIQNTSYKIEQFVEATYKCNVCNRNHTLRIKKKLIKNSPSFPVSYLYIHGNPKIFTTLYIDANGKIRGVEMLDSIGVSSNEFNDILDKSKSRTLKPIPSEKIFGFQWVKRGKIEKLFYQEGFENQVDFQDYYNIQQHENCNEIYFRYSDFWIVTLQMFKRSLIMAIDSSIDIERLKTQTMAIFETLK